MIKARVTDLFPATLNGHSSAVAVNDKGVVIGRDDFGTGLVWMPSTPNGIVGSDVPLPALIEPRRRIVGEVTPTAINTGGTIVGFCSTSDPSGAPVTRAFFFIPSDTTLTDLGTLDVDAVGLPWQSSKAFGIDDIDTIVGWAHDSSGIEWAFVGSPGASTVQSFFHGHYPSQALGIRNGMIVGDATIADAAGVVRRQAFRSLGNGTLEFLGTLLPSPLSPTQFFGDSRANGVSNQGTIVGISDALPPIVRMGLIFGVPSIVPPLPFGPLPSEALAVATVSTKDVVVGHYWPSPPAQDTAGFMFDNTNGLVDLNTRLLDTDWHVDSATGINKEGQICGIGTHSSLGGPRAILLTF
ncbi:hypothetical protein HIV01_005085 [Lysobacter arenosi]|uniref:DUF3466 family protein n=1 Tax=Lysobacter arenosi TaxID=2795387 RepID=A0ABX7RCY9_9GAMM|nr:hypothetical protein [Lysobacter arenosi]QSX75885.1 hypothetical protein HIV01_005085 [Lysobacter arenosi]